jgi:phosphomannomutase/phosphoglucomutase
MSFAQLLRGSSLRGDATSLDARAAARLGRALGTLVRRRTSGGKQKVVVARADDGATLPVRDGLVQGLLLSGHDVKDIGTVGSDVFTFALRHLGAAGGVVVTTAGEGALSLIVFLAGRPVVGEGLQALAHIADGDDFAAGEGALELLDVVPAFRAAPKDIDAESAT